MIERGQPKQGKIETRTSGAVLRKGLMIFLFTFLLRGPEDLRSRLEGGARVLSKVLGREWGGDTLTGFL